MKKVLLQLIEEWREELGNKCVVRAVLMDLSKAFDCIPHDLIIAKMASYGLNFNDLKLILSFLQARD